MSASAMSEESFEELLVRIQDPAQLLNADVIQCQDDNKPKNCDAYFETLQPNERALLESRLACLSQKNLTNCSYISTWLKRKLPGYTQNDTVRFRTSIEKNIALVEKHQEQLSQCLPNYDQLAKNICFLKPNLDAMQIKMQKVRVTPDGLFNDYDREVEWLVLKTPSKDIELSTPVYTLDKGLISFYVTKVDKQTNRGRTSTKSNFNRPVGLYLIEKKEIRLENPRLTTSTEDYYGSDHQTLNFEFGADITFSADKLKPNINTCETYSNAPQLISQAREKLGKGWDPNNAERLANESISSAKWEGLQVGLYNFADAGKSFVEGIEGLWKLITNAETVDPKGENQCLKEENKAAAIEYGNTCSGMFTILKRVMGEEADVIFGTCYRQHCDVKSKLGKASCALNQAANPVFQANMIGCVGFMMKERYGEQFVDLVKKCTLQKGGDEFSRCMSNVAVLAAGGILTAGAGQGVAVLSKAAQVSIQAAVKAGQLSLSSVKWLTRLNKASKGLSLFTVDMLFNPLPVDPTDLLKTRKGLLEFLKQDNIPQDLAEKAQRLLEEVDGKIKAADTPSLEQKVDTPKVDSDSIPTKPNTETRAKNPTNQSSPDEQKLTTDLAQNMHTSWRKTFQEKNGDAVRNKPVPLDPSETPESALKRLEAEGYRGLTIENNVLVQNINQEAKDIVPSLSLALNGGPAKDYAKIALSRNIETPADVEKMADEIHKKWMEHNSWQKDSAPQLFVPYNKLTPEEKLKDLDVLEEALRLKDPKILDSDAYKRYRKTLTDEINNPSVKPANDTSSNVDELAKKRIADDKAALEELRRKLKNGEELTKAEEILAEITGNGKTSLIDAVKKNSKLTITERAAKLEAYLNKKGKALSNEQIEALRKAHSVGENNPGSEVYKYTDADISQKIKILKDAGFKSDEIYYILKSGLAGGAKPGLLSRLLGSISGPYTKDEKLLIQQIKADQSPLPINSTNKFLRSQNVNLMASDDIVTVGRLIASDSKTSNSIIDALKKLPEDQRQGFYEKLARIRELDTSPSNGSLDTIRAGQIIEREVKKRADANGGDYLKAIDDAAKDADVVSSRAKMQKVLSTNIQYTSLKEMFGFEHSEKLSELLTDKVLPSIFPPESFPKGSVIFDEKGLRIDTRKVKNLSDAQVLEYVKKVTEFNETIAKGGNVNPVSYWKGFFDKFAIKDQGLMLQLIKENTGGLKFADLQRSQHMTVLELLTGKYQLPNSYIDQFKTSKNFSNSTRQMHTYDIPADKLELKSLDDYVDLFNSKKSNVEQNLNRPDSKSDFLKLVNPAFNSRAAKKALGSRAALVPDNMDDLLSAVMDGSMNPKAGWEKVDITDSTIFKGSYEKRIILRNQETGQNMIVNYLDGKVKNIEYIVKRDPSDPEKGVSFFVYDGSTKKLSDRFTINNNASFKDAHTGTDCLRCHVGEVNGKLFSRTTGANTAQKRVGGQVDGYIPRDYSWDQLHDGGVGEKPK
jgi:hypothetical protein